MEHTFAPDPAPAWLAAHRAVVFGASFDEVIGLRAAKRELRSLVARLRHPEIVLAAGGDLPRGAILSGPPGCGKTSLARATAGLLGAEVEFYSLPASELSAPRFDELSRYLAARPASSPFVVIYVDEIDLWGRNREDYAHTDATRATLLAALAAIDGLDTGAANRVLWLASTNRLTMLDSALIRAGRFGYHIRVGYPNLAERAEILALYGNRRRVVSGLDWRRAAALAGSRTTPADLRQALDDALAMALAEQGAAAVVAWPHVEAALLRGGQVTDLAPLDAAARFEIAVHEAGHAIACLVLIERPTAMSLRRDGGVTEAEADERGLADLTDSELRARISVALAGMAADRLILGEARMGGATDIRNATAIAHLRIQHGTDSAVRQLDFHGFDNNPVAAAELYAGVAGAMTEGRTRAEQLVTTHRAAILSLAAALAESGHLSGEDLDAALDAAMAAVPVEVGVPA